ncbi:MAG: hypothetical protein CMJ49_12750 [Planctomycetaceae bacterium]|nr:hypothetical protein [Planctomycetaceae bacterium]
MRGWTGRIVVAVLFVVVLVLPLAWSRPEVSAPRGGRTLIIISPHNEQIRYEVERAFSAWHAEKYDEAVDINWRNLGGTSDIERILKSRYTALAKGGKLEDGVGMDMVFGGGDYFFDVQLKGGIEAPIVGDGGIVETQRVSLTEPVTIDPAVLAAAYPEPLIADKMLYEPDGHWYGIVLASFGIVYNHDVLNARGLPVPRTWSDLTDFHYEGWMALADPSHSGSVRVTYDAILQRYGWERGMHTLRRVFANARYFAPNASKVPTDVSYGNAAAGMCIDFYGRYQSQKIGGGKRVGYVAPAGATVVTADPIAVLRGARNKEVAVRLIEFLLSVEGQAIWNFPKDDPMGPAQFELRRAPIRVDMYEQYLDRMIDQVNPFVDIAKPLAEGTPSYFSVVPTLMHAMCMDIHADLNAAWVAIERTDDPVKKAAMPAEFDRLPTTDIAEVWRDVPADGPSAERLAKWYDTHRYALARMQWAADTLGEEHIVAACAGLSDLIEQLRRTIDEPGALPTDFADRYRHQHQQVERMIGAMADHERMIDFQTALLTMRRPLWKKFSWAEDADRRRWTAFFKDQYRKVIALSKE